MLNVKNQRYALISVYDKSKLKLLCGTLKKYKINIISTGSTAKKIKSMGYKCHLVSSLTNFKEILGGRVKTLHPSIHASLLYNRKIKSHLQDFNKLQFPSIDYLIVNLYPFEKTISKSNKLSDCLNMIDIGGPALLRAAAKNYKYVTTICDKLDYGNFINNLTENNGKTSSEFREVMAKKVFYTTQSYDSMIFNWFDQNKNNPLDLNKFKKTKLKYGENPNQESYFYSNPDSKSLNEIKIQGKEIGYNNILDIDAGVSCIREFIEPTCVIIKHNTPSGVGSDKSIHKAFLKAFNADPISAFGGTVVLNRKLDKKTASIFKKKFFEIVVAKSFDKQSLQSLKIKKKLILINLNKISLNLKYEFKATLNGFIKQEKNLIKIQKKYFKNISLIKINTNKLDDLIFAMKVCKHVKSNAIVLVKNKQTIGIGSGQMSRLDSTKLALTKLKKEHIDKGFVAASDAFFPFKDNIKMLIKKKCTAIVQPMGSINDKKIVDFAKSKKFPLYSFKYRLFKH